MRHLGRIEKSDAVGKGNFLVRHAASGICLAMLALAVVSIAMHASGAAKRRGAQTFLHARSFAPGTLTFKTLYSFSEIPDGEGPYAGVIRDPLGNLYGTTSEGGSFTSGTVFKLDQAGTEIASFNFDYYSDGDDPDDRLTHGSSGNLYGTASGGGDYVMG